MKMAAISGYKMKIMPQPVVRKRIMGMWSAGIRLRTSGCTASLRIGVPPMGKGMPMRRLGGL